MEPAFVDLRVVQAGVLRDMAGIDPHTPDSHHAWNMPMNYPKVWVKIGKALQLQKEISLLSFAIVLIVFYLVACGIFISRYPNLYTMSFPFSFSSLLLIERGNNDLVIFTLLFYSIYISSSLAAWAILLSSALKLYPIFALGALFQNRKYLYVVGMATVAYFCLQFQEIIKVKSLTPVGGWCSYGVKSLILAFEYKFKTMGNVDILINEKIIYGLLCLLAGLFFYYLQRAPSFFEVQCQNLEKRFFLAGSGIFCGTFLLASNFDYRLCFLFFCLPYLSKLKNGKARNLCMVSLILAVNGNLIHMNVADIINLLSKALLFILLSGMGLSLFIAESRKICKTAKIGLKETKN